MIQTSHSGVPGMQAFRGTLASLLLLFEESGLWILVVSALFAFAYILHRRGKAQAASGRLERRLREELEAYARLEGSLAPGADPKPLARRVCHAIVEKSIFQRAAMLLRDAEGKLQVAGSMGMDDVAVGSLKVWGAGVIRQERGLDALGPAQMPLRERLGSESFVVLLRPKEDFDTGYTAGVGCRRVIVTLLRAQTGSILGALAVCADELLSGWEENIEEALPPLETLAIKLARMMENASLTDRLVRAERLAGLGQLAGGVAHELNNPLTSVLGFAELIAETTSETRVQEDARTIIREALRMRETVQSLLHFWRPITQQHEPLALGELLDELAIACAVKLEERGVALVMQAGDDLPLVSGDKERLRQMMQHLLNNAAQAIASSQEGRRAGDGSRSPGLPRGSDEEDRSPAIRVTVSHDDRVVHLIVSDTGPGFPEPSRVFDPFYTTKQPGAGTGLGLSICYGIVREHGGEISAFNLHPHGAAVVVELPLCRTVVDWAGAELESLVRSPRRQARREDQAVQAVAEAADIN